MLKCGNLVLAVVSNSQYINGTNKKEEHMKLADVNKLETKEQVNEQIQIIFRKHRITPEPGEEAFWDTAYDVMRLNHDDGVTLYRLGRRWDAVPNE